MDQLDITGLSVFTKIGVYAWEQAMEQRLLIDISIPCDSSHYRDELSDAIDYDKLCQTVTAFVESHAFALIETVANQIAQLIQTNFAIQQVTVRVAKPHAIKNAANISVTVRR
jgi:dihydroneopterin aldolase